MAGILAADVQYILNSITIPQYVKAFALDQTLLGVLGGLKTGKAIIKTKHHYAGNATAGSFGEGDDISTAGKQSRRNLTHSYKRIYVTAAVDGLVEAISRQGGYDEISDMVLQEANDAMEDLFDELNTQLRGDGTGNSSKDVQGLAYHIEDGNTWGGLARASYSWIQSYINENGGTPRTLTKTLLQNTGDTMVDTRKSNYDMVLTSRTMRNAYEDLLGDAKRYVNVQRGDIVVRELAFDGRPIIPIPGYSDKFDFIKASDFEVWALPQVARSQTGREVRGFVKVEPVSKTSDDTSFNLIMYVNLVCKNPWKAGSLQDVE